MPTYVWIAVWAVIAVGVTALVVRDKLSGRRGPGDIDTLQHSAVREASGRRDVRGPNASSGGFGM